MTRRFRYSIDYHLEPDLTGQANHIGSLSKLILSNKSSPLLILEFVSLMRVNLIEMYDALGTEHPIDLCRWQVANCYMGQIGLINSGVASKGGSDLKEAATAEQEVQV